MPRPISFDLRNKVSFILSQPAFDLFDPNSLQKLTAENKVEVLEFLARRPVHTIILTGFIRDNGIESPLHRGDFYAYRGHDGQLEGVALIGHSTLLETHNERAVIAFAHLASECPKIHLVMGEQKKIEKFWREFSALRPVPYSYSRELLYVKHQPTTVNEKISGLRLAGADDLEAVVIAHARMLEEEYGFNPLLQSDAEGFRQRCARRIAQNRVWVWREKNRLIFKADVISDTPEVNYLEGIYVDPAERGKGYGSRCLAQLSQKLLEKTRSLCILVNENNPAAQTIYQKAGYALESEYLSIVLS